MAGKIDPIRQRVGVSVVFDGNDLYELDQFKLEHRLKTRSNAIRVLIRRGMAIRKAENGKWQFIGQRTANLM